MITNDIYLTQRNDRQRFYEKILIEFEIFNKIVMSLNFEFSILCEKENFEWMLDWWWVDGREEDVKCDQKI